MEVRYALFPHTLGLQGVWTYWPEDMSLTRLTEIENAVNEWRRQVLLKQVREHLE